MPKETNRFMRIMLFFDLPTNTSQERKSYRKFRKFLINEGFIMLQKSVYSKLTTNYNSCGLEIDKVKNNKPDNGLIHCLLITEKQYSGIIDISGEFEHDQIDSIERFVIV